MVQLWPDRISIPETLRRYVAGPLTPVSPEVSVKP
jgi:hypothetical protein